MYMPSDAEFIIDTLINGGYKAYAVGGCVRDSIIGITPCDWDICTSACPDEAAEIFGGISGVLVHRTGTKHGTVTVELGGGRYEVTTFRIDGSYTDGRHPDSVSFTDDIYEDLRRRDFTINAIAYNHADGFIDPFDGIGDIKRKIISTVGNPKVRFEEDSLRILRAIRFSSKLGFDIESGTHSEIMRQYSRLSLISNERFAEELCKISVTDGFADALRRYTEVFVLFMPELRAAVGFKQNNPYHIYDVFEHILKVIENCPPADVSLRLAALLHDIGKPFSYQDDDEGVRHFWGHQQKSAEMAEEILKRLHFCKKDIRDISELVKYHDVQINTTDRCIKKWLNRLGEEQFFRLLQLKRADVCGQNPALMGSRIRDIETIAEKAYIIAERNECIGIKDLDINGRDLIAEGFKGREIGKILNILCEKVQSNELKNCRSELLDEARKLVGSD